MQWGLFECRSFQKVKIRCFWDTGKRTGTNSICFDGQHLATVFKEEQNGGRFKVSHRTSSHVETPAAEERKGVTSVLGLPVDSKLLEVVPVDLVKPKGF